MDEYTKIFNLLLKTLFNGFNLNNFGLIITSILLYPKSIKYLINPGKHSPWKSFFSIIKISFLFISIKKLKKLYLQIKLLSIMGEKKEIKKKINIYT